MAFMRTSITFLTFLREPYLETKKNLHCEGIDNEECLDEILEAPLSEPSFTKRTKRLSRLDGFKLYGKLGVVFNSTSELLYPNINFWARTKQSQTHFFT